MMSRKFGMAATAVAALMLSSGGLAQAQTAGATAAPVTHGPPLAGVCVFSSQQAVGTSTVGKYVGTRMQQIISQVNTELTTERTAIDTEAKALDAQKATLDKATLQNRATNLQNRFNTWQTKAGQRQREVEATEQKAFLRVAQEMDPIIKQAYQTNHCSILFERDNVILANPAMDLTPTVVAGVNAKIQQFAFDREVLPAQQQGQ
jgi:Skp family chaperone for outer membrane proteins